MRKGLYTADIHGNLKQYEKLKSYAIKAQPKDIIIGGDMAPKGFSTLDKLIKKQRKFFREDLVPFLKDLKIRSGNANIFLMMGNNDFKCNSDILEENESSETYSIIHNKRIHISEGLDIVGYSYVPITPFGIKDWEKYEDDNENESNIKGKNLEGFLSSLHGGIKYKFPPSSSDNIERDINSETFNYNPNKTIYVFHSPPHGGNLDLTYYAGHVGSKAISRFIEKNQPYLTLHGHIHETVKISKKSHEKNGNTISISSGNGNDSDALKIIEIDLENPSKYQLVGG